MSSRSRRMVSPAGRLVEARTVSLWVKRDGQGPPIVFLHGLGDDHRLWRYVVPRLRDQFETIVVDLPGHGQSQSIPDDAPIEWFGEEIVTLMDNLGVSDPVLVGLSMGGGIAQAAAISAPGRLRGLVLVSTSPVFDPPTRQRLLDRAVLARQGGMAPLVDMAMTRWFTPGFVTADPAKVADTRSAVLATEPNNFARASQANANRDLVPGLASIECPVLFVAGEDDPADPSQADRLYRKHITNLRVAMLDNASHLLPVEAPDRFVATLESFMASLPVAESN